MLAWGIRLCFPLPLELQCHLLRQEGGGIEGLEEDTNKRESRGDKGKAGEEEVAKGGIKKKTHFLQRSLIREVEIREEFNKWTKGTPLSILRGVTKKGGDSREERFLVPLEHQTKEASNFSKNSTHPQHHHQQDNR
jgi:hypothetical protein